jgi:signal transduction histidine kinase
MRIRNFVQPFNRYYPHIHFNIDGEASAEKILHYTKALNVVRIVQEAVTNAIKHSTASNITVISSAHKNDWRIEVRDDGKGFYEDTTTGTELGNGLQNMRQRAKEASFDLAINSQPGKGTAVIITV